MDLGLKDKVVLVTGGSKGIGLSIAQEFCREGAKVVIAARDQKALDSAVAELKKDFNNSSVLGVSCDATDMAAVGKCIDRIIDVFGCLDILINNVGGASRYGSFQELELEDWKHSFDLNVMSMVHFVRACEAYLVDGTDKRIITISSISGVQPGFYNPHYAAMKAATINLSKHLSQIYAQKGVRVSTICPGPVHSDAWEKNIESEAMRTSRTVDQVREEVEDRESLKIPLGRVGEGEDVAPLVAFLASEKADWITGSCFHINGGKLVGV